MKSMLGCGGESIVLRKKMVKENGNMKTAVKLVRILKIDKKHIDEIFGNIDSESAYKDEKPMELTANKLTHENIVRYMDNIFEVIDDAPFHLTGKS